MSLYVTMSFELTLRPLSSLMKTCSEWFLPTYVAESILSTQMLTASLQILQIILICVLANPTRAVGIQEEGGH